MFYGPNPTPATNWGASSIRGALGLFQESRDQRVAPGVRGIMPRQERHGGADKLELFEVHPAGWAFFHMLFEANPELRLETVVHGVIHDVDGFLAGHAPSFP